MAQVVPSIYSLAEQIPKLQDSIQRLEESLSRSNCYDNARQEHDVKNQLKYPQLSKKIAKLTGILLGIVCDMQTKEFSLDEINAIEKKIIKTQQKMKIEFDVTTNEIRKKCEVNLTESDVKKIKEAQYSDVIRDINRSLLEKNRAERNCSKYTDMVIHIKSYYESKGLLVTSAERAGDTFLTITHK